MEKKGYKLRYKWDKDDVILKEDIYIHGTIVMEVHYVCDSMKEAILEERRI